MIARESGGQHLSRKVCCSSNASWSVAAIYSVKFDVNASITMLYDFQYGSSHRPMSNFAARYNLKAKSHSCIGSWRAPYPRP